MPAYVRDRVKAVEHNRINKEGFLVLSAQEERSQHMNTAVCMQKIYRIVCECADAVIPGHTDAATKVRVCVCEHECPSIATYELLY
jgi:hypothetical protein